MSLRFDQWVERPGADRLEFLPPVALVEALGDADQLEWALVDSREELQLSGGEGSGYMELMEWYRAGRRVPTSDLVRALRTGYDQQLIWGELRAFQPGATDPVLTISAFDSTWYDIDGRADLIDRLSATF